MTEKKTKKSKKTTTKQTQKQKQSVVVNVNTSSVKRTKRKKRTTEVSWGRGNYVGKNISSGVPNNVIVHNNIDTAELARVLRQEHTAQLQPIQIQEKPRVQDKPPIIPPIYRSNSNATLPLNIEPLQHNTPQSITFNSPINTTPFVFEDRATPVAKNTRQQTKKKDSDEPQEPDLPVKKRGRRKLSEDEKQRREEEKEERKKINQLLKEQKQEQKQEQKECKKKERKRKK